MYIFAEAQSKVLQSFEVRAVLGLVPLCFLAIGEVAGADLGGNHFSEVDDEAVFSFVVEVVGFIVVVCDFF